MAINIDVFGIGLVGTSLEVNASKTGHEMVRAVSGIYITKTVGEYAY